MYCAAELGVTGGGARLHQRLEFPRLGPPLVVGDVGVQRAHQLAVFALRPQRGVHLEEGVTGEPHQLAGQPGRSGVRLVGDEDDVDVADVVQFARAALAHRDHREPRALAVNPDEPGRDRQRGAQRGIGQVGQMRTDLGERQHGFVLHRRRQVEGGQHQQPVAVELAQRSHRSHGVPCDFDAFGQLGECRLQLAAAVGSVTPPCEQVPRVGIGDQMIAERQRRTEHTEQPAAQPAVLDQGLTEFVPTPSGPHRRVGPARAARRRRRARATATTTARRARRCSSPAGPGPRARTVRPARAGLRWAASDAASQVWPRRRR